MNQFLENHQLNKAEIGVTEESISDWICGSQDTLSSSKKKVFTLQTLNLQDNVKQIDFPKPNDVFCCYLHSHTCQDLLM